MIPHVLARAGLLVATLLAAGAAFAADTSVPSFDSPSHRPPPPFPTRSLPSPAPGVQASALVILSNAEDGLPEIDGELIEGAGAGPHPAVLFVHWLGEPATTNHTEFEADAVALARLGVTSLLIDAPWSARDWFTPLGTSADADLEMSGRTVRELRRALDLLCGRPGVDRGRVAFVGHDFGAMFGMLMASVDRRPSWYVFMAPNSSMGEWYLWSKKTPDRDAYLARLGVLDPPKFLAQAKAKGFLLQFSGHDEYITPAHAAAIEAATPHPREVRTYDVDHSLETPQAHADRLDWLKTRLLSPP